MIRYFLIGMLFCAASMVRAEGGSCPSGMYPIGGQGVQGCAPIPGYYNDNNNDDGDSYDSGHAPGHFSSVRMIWEERWGAVANEGGGGNGFGVIAGVKSKTEAEVAALSQCKSTATADANSCEVVLSYRNQCVAYAWGGGYAVASSAIDMATAKKNALLKCGKESGKCDIYYSDCSYAEAVPQ